MKIRNIKTGVALFAACMLSSQAYALSIDDNGVVGTIEPASGSGSSVADETAWANYLLSLGENVVDDVADADNDNKDETYNTGNNVYDGTLTGGTRNNTGSTGNITGFEWVLAKYDGPNAGYILFNVADWGSASVPMYPCSDGSITSTNTWCSPSSTQQYALSHWTGWGGTPVSAPTTLMIMSLGLFGIGFGTWKKKHQA